MNETFQVFSVFDCSEIDGVFEMYQYNSLWRQNLMGCHMLRILKDYYQFNITYTIPTRLSNWTSGHGKKFLYSNTSIDIFAFPMTLQPGDWEHAYPVNTIINWKFGFLVKRIEKEVFRRYYTEPFSTGVWRVLYFLCFFLPLVFYMQARWERSIFGVVGECSYAHEFILAVGGYCQIMPPVEPKLASRRFAYCVFFFFTFVIHSLFTSELLSHLLYKTVNVYDLNTLIDNDYSFAILPDMELILRQTYIIDNANMTLIMPKLRAAVKLNASEGLKAVATSRTALLSDYFSLYPLMQTMFDSKTLCKLEEVDINSNMLKYFFTSKNFRYKEEFKISILRAKEAGLTDRWNLRDIWFRTSCSNSDDVQTGFTQIFFPFLTVCCNCVTATVVLIVERWWYGRRSQVWPYVD